MPRQRDHIYDPALMRSLEGVRIPQRLKCDRCNVFRNHASFSNKQLTDVRYAVKNGSGRWIIKCMPCAGQQVVEIECSICGITKGLEAFAKSQRRKIDTAECFKCTDKRLDVAPVKEGAYENDDDSRNFDAESQYQGYSVFDMASASDTSSEWVDSIDDTEEGSGGVGLSHDFARKMSMSAASNVDTLIETEYERGSQVSHDDGWQTVGKGSVKGSWHTPSGHSQNTPSMTNSSSRGFNPNKYGNPLASRSVSGATQRTFTSNATERSDAGTANMSANGKFAKIKAYVPPKLEWSSDEESDNSDDGDDDDSDGDL